MLFCYTTLKVLLYFCSVKIKIKIEMEAKIEVKSTIEKMEVGDIQSFDIELLPNVRSYASSVGLQYGRQYKTRTDRENMTITVERLA